MVILCLLIAAILFLATANAAEAQQPSPHGPHRPPGQATPSASHTPTARPTPQYGPGWQPPQSEGPPRRPSAEAAPAAPQSGTTAPGAAPGGAAPAPGAAWPGAPAGVVPASPAPFVLPPPGRSPSPGGSRPGPAAPAGAPLPPAPSPGGSGTTQAAPAGASASPLVTPVPTAANAAPGAPSRTTTPECGWLLTGTWSVEGEHTAGSLIGQAYRTAVTFRQFGDHLVGTQAEDTITYYGRCSSDDVELEVWIGWEYIGRQAGRVTPDGLAIRATWTLWSPEPMEGHETLTGRARRLR